LHTRKSVSEWKNVKKFVFYLTIIHLFDIFLLTVNEKEVIGSISKLKNARKYFIHQITKKLVLENDIIVSETLKVKEMLEEKKISKFLSDASLSKICNLLKSKAEYYGKRYIQIDTYYPSSQECSRCGYQNEKVKDLTVRDWICPKCGSYHDRDINASINILFEGIKKYMQEFIS
jgi:putative transposase